MKELIRPFFGTGSSYLGLLTWLNSNLNLGLSEEFKVEWKVLEEARGQNKTDQAQIGELIITRVENYEPRYEFVTSASIDIKYRNEIHVQHLFPPGFLSLQSLSLIINDKRLDKDELANSFKKEFSFVPTQRHLDGMRANLKNASQGGAYSQEDLSEYERLIDSFS